MLKYAMFCVLTVDTTQLFKWKICHIDNKTHTLPITWKFFPKYNEFCVIHKYLWIHQKWGFLL